MVLLRSKGRTVGFIEPCLPSPAKAMERPPWAALLGLGESRTVVIGIVERAHIGVARNRSTLAIDREELVGAADVALAWL